MTTDTRTAVKADKAMETNTIGLVRSLAGEELDPGTPGAAVGSKFATTDIVVRTPLRRTHFLQGPGLRSKPGAHPTQCSGPGPRQALQATSQGSHVTGREESGAESRACRSAACSLSASGSLVPPPPGAGRSVLPAEVTSGLMSLSSDVPMAAWSAPPLVFVRASIVTTENSDEFVAVFRPCGYIFADRRRNKQQQQQKES